MPRKKAARFPIAGRLSDRDRERFFAMVGRCISSEQFIEDHLEAVFELALGGDAGRARAIIEIVLGLEKRLALIGAALKDSPHHGQWVDLSKRARAAYEARNQIAHARSTLNAGGALILLDGDPKLPTAKGRVIHQDAPRMELRKRTRGGEHHVWTTDRLREEHARLERLFQHLVAFGMQLAGNTPPPHLLAL
jgi:hypothetical protein